MRRCRRLGRSTHGRPPPALRCQLVQLMGCALADELAVAAELTDLITEATTADHRWARTGDPWLGELDGGGCAALEERGGAIEVVGGRHGSGDSQALVHHLIEVGALLIDRVGHRGRGRAGMVE